VGEPKPKAPGAKPRKPELPKGVPADIDQFVACTGATVVLRGGKVAWIKSVLKEQVGDLGDLAPDPTVTLTPNADGSVHVSVAVGLEVTAFDLSVDAAGELVAAKATAFGDAIGRWIRDANAWLKKNGKKLGPPKLVGGDLTLSKVAVGQAAATAPAPKPPVPPSPTPAPKPADPPTPPTPGVKGSGGAGLEAAALILGGATPSNYDPAVPPVSPILPPDGLIPDEEWAYYQEHKHDPGGYVPPSTPIGSDTGHYDAGHDLLPPQAPPPPGHDIDDGSHAPTPAPPPVMRAPDPDTDTSAIALPTHPGEPPTPHTDPELPPGVNKPQPHVPWDESGAEMSDHYERDAALFLGSAILPDAGSLPAGSVDALDPPPFGWDAPAPSDPGDHEVASADSGGGPRVPKLVVGGILAVLLIVAAVVVVISSSSGDGPGDETAGDGPAAGDEPASEATSDAEPSDGGTTSDDSTLVDEAAGAGRPISYASTCNGSQCNLYDPVSCTFTYQLQVTFDFPDGASHDGETATVATAGPGWEPTYEVSVVDGGLDATLTATHCLASGESASWRAVVTAVGGEPTITPDPPA
jgi:hypothetical protein